MIVKDRNGVKEVYDGNAYEHDRPNLRRHYIADDCEGSPHAIGKDTEKKRRYFLELAEIDMCARVKVKDERNIDVCCRPTDKIPTYPKSK